MAELLFKAVSFVNSNPIKDRAAYKRGDLVVMFENGHPWGAEELKPPATGGKFVVVKITDVTVAQVVNFIRNKWNCAAFDGIVDVRRRRISLDVDLMPNPVKNQMNNNGQFSNTWANIRQYVRDRLTNTTATGGVI